MRGRRAATASLRRRPLTVLSPPDPSTENLDLAVFTLLEYSRLAGGLKKIQLCCYVDGEKNVVYKGVANSKCHMLRLRFVCMARTQVVSAIDDRHSISAVYQYLLFHPTE